MPTPRPDPRSATTRRPVRRRGLDRSPLGPALVAGGGWGLVAALVVHLLSVLVTLVVWVASPSGQWEAADSVGVGLRANALAHGAATTVGQSAATADGQQLTLHGGPTLLAVLGAWGVWRAVRTLVTRVESAGEGQAGDDVVLASAGAVAGGYVLGHVLPVLVAGGGGLAAPMTWTLGLLLVAGLAALCGLLSACTAERRDVWFSDWPRDAGEAVQDALAPATRTLLELAAASLAVALVTVLAHWSQVSAVQGQLGATGAASVLLVLVQLGWFPSALAWAGAWLSGAGVHLGEGALTPGGSPDGALPAVPLLAALPDAGTFSPAWWAVLLVPVALGTLVPPRARAQAEQFVEGSGWVGVAVRSAVACLLVAVFLTAVGPLVAAGVAPGPLDGMGPPAWWGLALGGELLLGAALRMGVEQLLSRR
ncbi:cell division protein PerM [Kytococcus sp. Marseille-QA3725]